MELAWNWLYFADIMIIYCSIFLIISLGAATFFSCAAARSMYFQVSWNKLPGYLLLDFHLYCSGELQGINHERVDIVSTRPIICIFIHSICCLWLVSWQPMIQVCVHGRNYICALIDIHEYHLRLLIFEDYFMRSLWRNNTHSYSIITAFICQDVFKFNVASTENLPDKSFTCTFIPLPQLTLSPVT